MGNAVGLTIAQGHHAHQLLPGSHGHRTLALAEGQGHPAGVQAQPDGLQRQALPPLILNSLIISQFRPSGTLGTKIEQVLFQVYF